MLDAVEATARKTLSLIDSILDLLEEARERARNALPETSYSKELIETIFNQPYTKIEHVVDRGLAAFEWLENQLLRCSDTSPRTWLEQGLSFHGEKVTLIWNLEAALIQNNPYLHYQHC